MGLGITNTFHEDATKSLLRQILALWYMHYIIQDKFGGRSTSTLLELS